MAKVSRSMTSLRPFCSLFDEYGPTCLSSFPCIIATWADCKERSPAGKSPAERGPESSVLSGKLEICMCSTGLVAESMLAWTKKLTLSASVQKCGVVWQLATHQ